MARILIVDDDEKIRQYLADLLERSGHTVETALDGIDALAKVASSRPDLVVTDIVMPRKEGLELILELKLRYHALPIIAISGGLRPTHGISVEGSFYLELARELGAEHILPKPFHPIELLHMIQKSLDGTSETS